MTFHGVGGTVVSVEQFVRGVHAGPRYRPNWTVWGTILHCCFSDQLKGYSYVVSTYLRCFLRGNQNRSGKKTELIHIIYMLLFEKKKTISKYFLFPSDRAKYRCVAGKKLGNEHRVKKEK